MDQKSPQNTSKSLSSASSEDVRTVVLFMNGLFGPLLSSWRFENTNLPDLNILPANGPLIEDKYFIDSIHTPTK